MSTQTTPRRPRKVGPTGVLVWAGDPIRDRESWLAERRQRMQGTDLPKLLGLSNYGTALDVWASKTRRATDDPEPSFRARMGNLLEPVVAGIVQEDQGVRLRRVGITAHERESWMGCSIDRLERGCPLGRGFREIKTRSEFVAGRWHDDMPDDVLAQTQWNLAVTGFDHAHVDCLLGFGELRTFVVRPEPDVQRLLVAEARDLWKWVEADERPPVDPDEATGRVLDALDRLIVHVEGSKDVDPGKALPLIERYEKARRAEADARAAKKDAEAGLAVLLDGHETALVDGEPAYTRKPGTWSGYDTERLQSEWPDAHEACRITKPTRPTLRIKKEYQL